MLEIREETRNDVLVLVFSGEMMGGEEAGDFQKRVYSAIEQSSVNVVIDMTGLKWMNSSGLGFIMAGLTTLRAGGGDLRLCCASDRVRRPIEVTRLDRVIQMFDSVDEAVGSFSEGG
ncbi:MAG TPA: anti-sigma factor antagonist [bacterium]|nr:anti-sigma factor antagonist [bacterium]